MLVIYIMMLVLQPGNSQFPEDMYVTEDRGVITDLITEHQLEERKINETEAQRVTMSDLMPYPCDDLENMHRHYLRDFGQVATHERTYTETMTTLGRYYATTTSYDKACACPPVYQVSWNSSRGKHRIFSSQLRGGYVPQETTQIVVEKREMYVVFNDGGWISGPPYNKPIRE